PCNKESRIASKNGLRKAARGCQSCPPLPAFSFPPPPSLLVEIVSTRSALVLPAKGPAPPYAAVTLCCPVERADVVKVATPQPSRTPVPRGVPLSRKVTTPGGVPAPGLTTATVAVKVTGWPACTAVAEVSRMMLVAAALTVWVLVPELAAKLP